MRHHDVPGLMAAIGAFAGAEPDAPALTFYRGRQRVTHLSYADLVTGVERAARALAGLGLRPGERVALLSPNRPEVALAFLAAMRLGLAVVPLNPTAPPEDWDYILGHADARLLLVEPALLPRVQELPVRAVALDALPEGPAPAPPPDGLADDLAVILYTSGTTGQPKGVALAQRSVLHNAWSMARNFGLERTTQMAVLPLHHAHAFGFGLMSALTTGGHLVLCERFDAFAWPEVIRAEEVAYTSVVPTLLPALLETRAQAERVPTLRALLVSSAPLSAALARDFEERTRLRLVQGWGLSEYTNFACCLSPALPDDERRALLYGGELTSIGPALPGTEVRVVDERGRDVPAGTRGELAVRGDSRMIGYFRDSEASRRAIDDGGWLHTGGQGLYVLHGGTPHFQVSGRIKEIIIRGGEKLSPLAIERRLCAALPELEGRLVVLGFAHGRHGEEVGAYLEAEAPPDAGRLAEAVATLPIDQRPKVLLWGPRIPRTHTGKIQRRKLAPLFERFADARGPLRVERATG